MAYTDPTPFKIPRRYQAASGVNVETITTAKTLTYSDSMVQLLDNSTGGTLEVILPDYNDGAIFAIKATGTHGLSIKRASLSVVVSLAAGEGCLLVSTGDAASSDWVSILKA